MPITEAVVMYEGRGVTSRVRSLSPTAISVQSPIAPQAGEIVTVFIEGFGRFDSRVTFVNSPRIDLTFLTDTQARWRQLQDLHKRLSKPPTAA